MRAAAGILRLAAWPSSRALRRTRVLSVAALHGTVDIDRDERGIPWIRAGDERDLYVGVGVAMAYDRLWQMDVLRRRATGRLAEVFGARAAGSDVLARTLAFERAAHRSEALLSPPARANLAAFAHGVDTAVRRMRRRGQLPPEFHLLRYRPGPWSVGDSLAVVKQLGFHLGRNLQQEVFRGRLLAERPEFVRSFLAPKYPPGGSVTIRADTPAGPAGRRGDTALLSAAGAAHLDDLFGGRQGSGSNAWAVSPVRSATGFAALANDPHILFTQPSLWYQLGLDLDGERAYGVTVPGVPGLVIGANPDLAWGVTNSTIDTQDLAVGERPGPAGEPRWSQTSVVRVRGGTGISVRAAGGTGYVDLPDPGGADVEPVALYWSGLHPSTEAESCQRMWRARDYPAFRETLRGFGVPVLNLVVATRDGTVALRTAGIVPRRDRREGLAPAGAAEVAARWSTTLGFDELPEVVDPPAGFVVSANHQILPDGVAPHLGSDWGGPYRADRIEELLTATPTACPDDFGAWQMDLRNGRAQRILPTLLKALDENPPELPLAVFGHQSLAAWDGRDDAGQAAPLVFGALTRVLTERWITGRLGAAVADAMTDVTLQVDHLVMDADARRRLGETEDLPVVVADALTEAARRLADRFGDAPAGWRYDRSNRIADQHPLAAVSDALRSLYGSPPTPVGGGGQSVCLMYPDRDGQVVEGAPWRFVVEFGPSGSTRIRDVLRHGSSGHPLSPHYGDQTSAHAEGRLYEVRLDSPPEARSRLTLAPRAPGRRPGTSRLRGVPTPLRRPTRFRAVPTGAETES